MEKIPEPTDDGPVANLFITVGKARKIRRSTTSDYEFSSPYIQIGLEGSDCWRQTRNADNIENPMWGETITIPLYSMLETRIQIIMWAHRRHRSTGEETTVRMGAVQLPLNAFTVSHKRHEEAETKWIYLHALATSGALHDRAGGSRSTVVKGELEVAISCDYEKLKKKLTFYRKANVQLDEDGPVQPVVVREIGVAVEKRAKEAMEQISKQKKMLSDMEARLCHVSDPSEAENGRTRLERLRSTINKLEEELGANTSTVVAPPRPSPRPPGSIRKPSISVPDIPDDDDDIPLGRIVQRRQTSKERKTYHQQKQEETKWAAQRESSAPIATGDYPNGSIEQSIGALASKVTQAVDDRMRYDNDALSRLMEERVRNLQAVILQLQDKVEDMALQMRSINAGSTTDSNVDQKRIAALENEYKLRISELETALARKERELAQRDAELKQRIIVAYETILSKSDTVLPPSTSNRKEMEQTEAALDARIKELSTELGATEEKLMRKRIENKTSFVQELEQRKWEVELQLSSEADSIPPPPPPPASAGGAPPPPPPIPFGGLPAVTPRPPPMPSIETTSPRHNNTSPIHPASPVSGQADPLSKMLEMMQKLEQLDDIVEELKNIKSMGLRSGADESGPKRKLTDVQAEMEEKMRMILDENASDRDRELANIEYERLLVEMEKLPEFQEQQKQLRADWDRENVPKNKAAWEELTHHFTPEKVASDPTLKRRFQRNPELALICIDSSSILNKHEAEFKTFTVQGLSSQEMRAIYHNLPKFRRDQKVQQEWTTSLERRIAEQEKREQHAPPKRTVTPRKVVMAKPKVGGAGPSDFLSELMAKRNRLD